MIGLTYDLHIHSCLSPCGDMDMTPANIAGMAALMGLDVIALTDHNTCKNCPAFLRFAEEYGVLALPGMELTTAEEVHVVCLFETLEDAMRFDEYVYERLLPIDNVEEIFGKQQICGEDDEPCGTVGKLLINATTISFEDVYELVSGFGGVMIPAHIDKSSNSLISNLGFVPEDSRFTTVELKDMKKLHELKRMNPYLEKCTIISDSDSHYLDGLNEPEYTLYVEEKTRAGVLRALGKK